jgi:hypothetical protein
VFCKRSQIGAMLRGCQQLLLGRGKAPARKMEMTGILPFAGNFVPRGTSTTYARLARQARRNEQPLRDGQRSAYSGRAGEYEYPRLCLQCLKPTVTRP